MRPLDTTAFATGDTKLGADAKTALAVVKLHTGETLVPFSDDTLVTCQ